MITLYNFGMLAAILLLVFAFCIALPYLGTRYLSQSIMRWRLNREHKRHPHLCKRLIKGRDGILYPEGHPKLNRHNWEQGLPESSMEEV